MYLLDTNVVSALRFPHRQPAHVRAWAGGVDFAQCYLSVISLMEIEVGILRLERRDRHGAVRLRKWFEQEIRQTFEASTLPIDVVVAIACARLHVPDPRSERDALIAATAIVHGLAVVTRNNRHFRGLPVPVINPWQPA